MLTLQWKYTLFFKIPRASEQYPVVFSKERLRDRKFDSDYNGMQCSFLPDSGDSTLQHWPDEMTKYEVQ